MRVSPRVGHPELAVLPEASSNPIKMHIAGVSYRMNPDEALELANKLADAVEELQNPSRKSEQGE